MSGKGGAAGGAPIPAIPTWAELQRKKAVQQYLKNQGGAAGGGAPEKEKKRLTWRNEAGIGPLTNVREVPYIRNLIKNENLPQDPDVMRAKAQQRYNDAVKQLEYAEHTLRFLIDDEKKHPELYQSYEDEKRIPDAETAVAYAKRELDEAKYALNQSSPAKGGARKRKPSRKCHKRKRRFTRRR